MSIAELRSIAEQTRDHGKTLALAGQLSLADLPKLHAVNPDIIAIRSAACRDENRSFEIHSTAVRNFKTAIETEFSPSTSAKSKLLNASLT